MSLNQEQLKDLLKLPLEELEKTVRSANMELHENFAHRYDTHHPQQMHPLYQKRLFADLYEISAFAGRDKALNQVKVLDLGSGTGFLPERLLRIADFQIMCVDFSSAMLEQLMKKIPARQEDKVKIVSKDVFQFCREDTETYDIVTMSAVLHHVVDYKQLLEAAAERVDERGILYIAFEPLKDANMDENVYRIHCIVRELDNLLVTQKEKDTTGEKSYDDLTLADFQTLKGGIKPGDLTQILQEKNFQCRTDEFYVRNDENLAWFGQTILGARNTFSILAKRG